MTIDEMTIDEAIELLKDKRIEINYKVNGTTRFSKALDMAIEALESQMWIPISEPPKETGEYIVTIRWRNYYHYGDYKYSVVKRKYYADVKTWDDSLVIAYMPKPLPEPYTERGGVRNDIRRIKRSY